MSDLYQHYKGGVYRFVTYARMENTKNEMIVYESILSGERWIRPVKDFERKFTRLSLSHKY